MVLAGTFIDEVESTGQLEFIIFRKRNNKGLTSLSAILVLLAAIVIGAGSYYTLQNTVTEADTQTGEKSLDSTHGGTGEFVVTIKNDNGPITEGENLKIDYRVENTGQRASTQDVEFEIAEIGIEKQRTHTVSGKNTDTGTFEWNITSGLDEEEYNYEVRTEDDSGIGVVELPNTKLLDAQFSYSPTNPGVSQSINITGLSKAEKTEIKEYKWDFGDGNKKTGENLTNISYKYSSEGEYPISLTIKDENGQKDVHEREIDVEGTEDVIEATSSSKNMTDRSRTKDSSDETNEEDKDKKDDSGGDPKEELNAKFKQSTINPAPNEKITFDASDSSLSNGNIESYEWQFGDGETGVGETISHKYDSEGKYRVTLLIEASEYTSNKTKVINVEEIGDELEGSKIGGGEPYDRKVCEKDHDIKLGASSDLSDLKNSLEEASSGEIVFIDSKAEINLGFNQNSPSVEVPEGVTLASDRGCEGSSGALLTSEPKDISGWAGSETIRLNDKSRVTGLRIEGPQPNRDMNWHDPDQHDTDHDYTDGIVVKEGSEVEIDNNVLYGWPTAAVRGGKSHIHHNFIFDNNQRGLGYGISSTETGSVIEFNRFERNRHAVAGSGEEGIGYIVRYNTFGSDGIAGAGHKIDMHADDSGKAGSKIEVYRNTVRYPDAQAVYIRGELRNQAEIYDNWFYSTEDPCLSKNRKGNYCTIEIKSDDWSNLDYSDNHYGESEPECDIGAPREGC